MKGRPGKQPAVGLLLVSAEEATIAEWQPRGVEILRKQELRRNEAEEHEADDRSLSRPRRSGATKTAPQRERAQGSVGAQARGSSRPVCAHGRGLRCADGATPRLGDRAVEKARAELARKDG